jgi:predicted RNase H-like HicB family nuclease
LPCSQQLNAQFLVLRTDVCGPRLYCDIISSNFIFSTVRWRKSDFCERKAIHYWFNAGAYDLETGKILLESERFPYTFFFATSGGNSLWVLTGGTFPNFRGGKKVKFLITIFQDEDGMFVAECPSIPGCVSQGKTTKDAEKNIREAIKECLEVRAEKGMPLTVATRKIEVHV